MKAEAPSIVLFTLAKRRSLDPAIITVFKVCCQRYNLLALHVQHFKLCPQKKNRDKSVRWMDHQTKRKPRSPSICATHCDRPVLLVLSLFQLSEAPTIG